MIKGDTGVSVLKVHGTHERREREGERGRGTRDCSGREGAADKKLPNYYTSNGL